MTIKVTFLGTADSIPTAKRNHTAILINFNDENVLVDCGEGTQRQFRKAKLNPCKVTRILISHWHGDHVLGLPGLLQTLAFSNYNKTLFIYGPKGTKNFMQELFRVFAFSGKIKLKVEEVSGKFFETKDFYLEAKSVIHGIPCNAYNFVKKGQIKIDKNKLKKSKLPSGPLLQKLKHGKNISYLGKKYLAKNLTYEEGDKKISIVLDASYHKNLISFARNSDLFICESSFGSELEDKAEEYKHLTAKQAAKIAQNSNSKKLILTHISQRYDKNPKKILNEAKKVFRNSFLVNDLDEVRVK